MPPVHRGEKRDKEDEKVKKNFDQAMELWKSNQHNAALALLSQCEKMTKDEEDLGEVCLYKGWVLEEKGFYDEAIKAFDSAISLSTDSFVVPYALHGQGSCHLNKGNFIQAQHFFKRACELYEPLLKWKDYQDYFYSCHTLLIHSLLLCGQMEDALKVRRTLESRGDIPSWFIADTAKELGHYFYKKVAYEKSVPYYEEALRATQEDSLRSEILFYLGSALWHTGEREKGRLLVQEGLHNLTNPEMRKEAEEFLRLAAAKVDERWQ